MRHATLRPATHEDIPQLVAMGEGMHHESRYARMPYAHAKVAAMLQLVMTRGRITVAERDGEIIGAFAGIVEEHWFSTDKIATDMALYVVPGKRGGFAAAQLVEDFLQWAKAQGAVMTDLLINTGVRNEATAHLFERLGGEPVGLIYSWRTR